MKEIIETLKREKLIKNNSELAEMLGINIKTVSDWTTEKYFPSFDKVKKISAEYNIDIVIKMGKIFCFSGKLREKEKEEVINQEFDQSSTVNLRLINLLKLIININGGLVKNNSGLVDSTKMLVGSNTKLVNNLDVFLNKNKS